MKKKLFAVAILLAVFSFALVSFVSANTNMDSAVNGVRNFVGGAENVIEDAGQGAANGIKNGLNAIGNGAKDVTNGVENGLNDNGNNNGNSMRTTGTSNNGNDYTATRTTARSAADTGSTGLFNTSNIWTWVVLAIAGAIIVGLVMYYAKQNNVTTYDNNNDD